MPENEMLFISSLEALFKLLKSVLSYCLIIWVFHDITSYNIDLVGWDGLTARTPAAAI